jgi:murein DD-endopeptidase MepM/ murein hydrolase activator NlpD
MRGPNPKNIFKNLGVMTVQYGQPTSMEQAHQGVDFANDQGTPIPSSADGVVTKVDEGHVQGENNFGNTVEIRDKDGNTHQFHHLQNIGVQQGQQVATGNEIATMGNTGATYSKSGKGDGTHLDYRIVDAYGRYMNPMMYLNKNR